MLPALASSLQADLNLTQEDVALLVLVQACGCLHASRCMGRLVPASLFPR